jgi:Cu+-exporting ATPase
VKTLAEEKGAKNENKMTFRVTGMTCATCSRIVERSLSKVPGVSFASVNLATESAFVIAATSVTFETLRTAVKNSGYDIFEHAPADLDEVRYREARHSLIFIMALGIPMSAVMIMHMAFGMQFVWYSAMEIIGGGIAIFYGGRRTLRGAWIAVTHGHTNMDTLISISASASWLTAVIHAFQTMNAGSHMKSVTMPSFGTVGVMILMLHLTGRYIESHLRDRAAKRVKALLTLQPREARVVMDGKEIMVPVDAVKPDAIIRVRAGERIPLDGIVEEGTTSVDESLLTGESMPVTKDKGCEVTGGAMNLSGIFTMRTTKTGEDTFLAKMLSLVREAQGSKVPLQAIADRITLKFVPAVIFLAVLSAAAWYCGYDVLSQIFIPVSKYLPWPAEYSSPAGAALNAFVATLVIACPCALGLATPLALVASTGEASRCGLLIRNAEAIQTLHEVDTALLDKTGTITKGEPKTTEWKIPEDAKPYVYALESNSGHPLAKAICNTVGEQPFNVPDTLSETPGQGVTGRWNSDEWFVGRSLDRSLWTDRSIFNSTIVEVRHNGKPVGFFTFTDSLRDDSKQAIKDLKDMGITPIMATGDNMDVAIEIAQEAGIEDVKWEVRPEEKLSIVQQQQTEGRKVLMAGDGINDAAALKGAHVGVAMGSGMDLAVDSADIVIVKGGLSKIVSAVKISAKTWSVIRQNLFGAFFYNIIAIPLAMSGLLHPLAAELAMAASSITVILNSLRISGAAEEKIDRRVV